VGVTRKGGAHDDAHGGHGAKGAKGDKAMAKVREPFTEERATELLATAKDMMDCIMEAGPEGRLKMTIGRDRRGALCAILAVKLPNGNAVAVARLATDKPFGLAPLDEAEGEQMQRIVDRLMSGASLAEQINRLMRIATDDADDDGSAVALKTPLFGKAPGSRADN